MSPKKSNKICFDERSFKKITEKLAPNLKFTSHNNPQLIITFSGIPSSGKTSIAKKLEEKYKAIRINGDILYDIVSEIGMASDYWSLTKIKDKYVLSFLENNPFKNKLIVLDKSIDRIYNKFFEVCKRNGFRYFIIQLELPKGKAKRISDLLSHTKVWSFLCPA